MRPIVGPKAATQLEILIALYTRGVHRRRPQSCHGTRASQFGGAVEGFYALPELHRPTERTTAA